MGRPKGVALAMTPRDESGLSAPPHKGSSPERFVPTPPSKAEPTPAPRVPSKTPLYAAVNAPRYARQGLIKEIETITATNLICYVSPRRLIDRDDVIATVDLLHNITPGSPIDLLLHSPGGDIDAAEKLITLIRRRAGDAPVRVVIPDFAKSAATLIALGANTIVMSDSSELGVIDPQVELPDSNGHLQSLSAQSYLDAFRLHATNLKDDPDDPVARLMLSKMEPAVVRKLERMTTRSRSIAEALLQTAMVKQEDTAREIAKDLSNTKKWHSHGQMISHEAALKVGLSVSYLPPNDPLWLMYWSLFCLQITGSSSDSVKLFEGSFASLAL